MTRPRAATRSTILDTACRLFAQRGVHAVTTAEIAQAAGVSTGTFFRCVPTKDELLVAAFNHAQWQLCEGVGRGPAFPRDTVYDVIRRVWEATASRALAQPQLFAYWVLAGVTPGVGQRDYAQPRLPVFHGVERLLAQVLAAPAARGELLAQGLEAQWVATVQYTLGQQDRDSGLNLAALLAQGYVAWWAGVGLLPDGALPT